MPKSWFYVVSNGLQKEKEQRKIIKLYEIGDSLSRNQIINLQNYIITLDSSKKNYSDYNFFLENKIKIDSLKFTNKIINYENEIINKDKKIKSYKTTTNIGIISTVLVILKFFIIK